MAKRVQIKIDKKGIGQMLKGQDEGNRIKEALAAHMDSVATRAQSGLPGDVHVDRRDYVGHDRLRSTAGIPGSLEARDGTLSRAFGVSGKLKGR